MNQFMNEQEISDKLRNANKIVGQNINGQSTVYSTYCLGFFALFRLNTCFRDNSGNSNKHLHGIHASREK